MDSTFSRGHVRHLHLPATRHTYRLSPLASALQLLVLALPPTWATAQQSSVSEPVALTAQLSQVDVVDSAERSAGTATTVQGDVLEPVQDLFGVAQVPCRDGLLGAARSQ